MAESVVLCIVQEQEDNFGINDDVKEAKVQSIINNKLTQSR